MTEAAAAKTAKKTGKAGASSERKAARYDYGKLFDGGVHTLVPGKDFTGTSISVVKRLRFAAKKQSAKVKIERLDDGKVKVSPA